jgi:P27 family predicted phage terminase small subunit
MARRGPKPKRAPVTAGVVPGDRWACPGHLSGDAAAAWDLMVGWLKEAGNLDRTAPHLVETYALNVAMLRAAQIEIAARGLTFETSHGGVMANPACAILNAASMRIKAIVTDLGMCPAASKQAAGRADKPTTSKWDGLLGVVSS